MSAPSLGQHEFSPDFSSDFWGSISGSGETGTQAWLKADFNKGADWTFRVIAYDIPVLGDAAGQTGSFTIPAEFNGDLLATMEARYEDGSNAGPQNWTLSRNFHIRSSRITIPGKSS
nr:hypothetical protein [Cohnella algarum]